MYYKDEKETYIVIHSTERPGQFMLGKGWYEFCKNHKLAKGDAVHFFNMNENDGFDIHIDRDVKVSYDVHLFL